MVSAFTRMRVSNFVRAPSLHHSTTNHVIVLHRGGRLNMLPRRARQTGTSHEECWFNGSNLRHRTESTLENSRQVVVPPAGNTSPSVTVCPSLSSLRLGPSHHALRALSPTAIRYRPSEQARRNPDAKQTLQISAREAGVPLPRTPFSVPSKTRPGRRGGILAARIGMDDEANSSLLKLL